MSTNALRSAVTGNQPTSPDNPFARDGLPSHVSAGAVAIEQQRAIAEAQGKLVIAKRFPRDQAAAYERLMESCSRRGLAEEAIYSFPRGGQTVEGPSIRLAEELARCWGNIDYGIRELSRREGESEMEAYAWDLETNTITSQKFTVKHIRDRSAQRGGNAVLTDERDIYEIGANMGARRLRARILAIIPGDLADAAVRRCRATLDGDSETPLADRVRTLVAEFGKLGVKTAHIEQRIGKKLDAMLPEDLTDLRGIFRSMRDGLSSASDWFGDAATGKRGGAALAAAAKAGHEDSDESAGDAAPTNAANVIAAMTAADDKDALDAAYDLLRDTAPTQAEREEATRVYDARSAELSP
jgi:hypothetical protein